MVKDWIRERILIFPFFTASWVRISSRDQTIPLLKTRRFTKDGKKMDWPYSFVPCQHKQRCISFYPVNLFRTRILLRGNGRLKGEQNLQKSETWDHLKIEFNSLHFLNSNQTRRMGDESWIMLKRNTGRFPLFFLFLAPYMLIYHQTLKLLCFVFVFFPFC